MGFSQIPTVPGLQLWINLDGNIFPKSLFSPLCSTWEGIRLLHCLQTHHGIDVELLDVPENSGQLASSWVTILPHSLFSIAPLGMGSMQCEIPTIGAIWSS